MSIAASSARGIVGAHRTPGVAPPDQLPPDPAAKQVIYDPDGWLAPAATNGHRNGHNGHTVGLSAYELAELAGTLPPPAEGEEWP
ncbi:MAG: hypothetical protein ACLPLP_19835 [Mycobacterium sp.]